MSVIFITAHDEYAINAIRFSALDYLLASIDVNELVAAVKKVGQKQYISARKVFATRFEKEFQ
ncbi:MAG: hypothetical protein R3B93_25275 [Bacteroidia bacterium]